MDKRSLCRVIVKLREAGAGPVALLQEILTLHPGATLDRLFTSVDTDTISRWVTKARQSDPGYRAPDFNSYYAISCTRDVRADDLVQRLSSLEAVELAYTELGFARSPGHRVGRPPGAAHPTAAEGVNGHDCHPELVEGRHRQGYLNPAPEGIDALYARQLRGGGSNIRFIDIEQGWQTWHEAVAFNTLDCTGSNDILCASHGTAVMGVIALQHNDTGCTGIAPAATGYVLSQWRPGGAFNTADAIMAAIGHLQFGDVLLLEAQTYHSATLDKTWPVEIHEASYQAIRLADALGIIVIEPAGNGSAGTPVGNDLDKYLSHQKPVFDPLSDHYLDSGAIMVGAASAAVPHTRMPWSNYGRRVNCYAWGERVVTAGSYPHSSGMAINTYTASFGGTSAAAAIIAGTAIVLQSIVETQHRFRLGPSQMRSLLGGDNYGTPSARGRFGDKIGMMPDLRKIIESF